MGQSEVLNVVEKAGKPLSLGEIAKELGYDVQARCCHKGVSHAIAKLLKYRELKCIEIDRFQAKEKYNCDRRMRLYYV
jgi:hypothetical protein